MRDTEAFNVAKKKNRTMAVLICLSVMITSAAFFDNQ